MKAGGGAGHQADATERPESAQLILPGACEGCHGPGAVLCQDGGWWCDRCWEADTCDGPCDNCDSVGWFRPGPPACPTHGAELRWWTGWVADGWVCPVCIEPTCEVCEESWPFCGCEKGATL